MADDIIDLKPTAPLRRDPNELGGRRWSGVGECPDGQSRLILLVTLAAIVAIIGGALTFGAKTGLKPEHKPYALGATILGVGVFALFAVFRSRRGESIEIAAYEHGMVYSDGVETYVVRWPEVSTVSEALVHLYDEQGTFTERKHYLRVITKDGDDHWLELGTIADSERLAGYVHDGTLPHLMPRAIEKLNAGRPVAFGPITISLDGLISDSDELMTWGEMASADLVNGSLVVCRKGDQHVWFERPIMEIPNAQVLLHLIKGRALAEAPPPVAEGEAGRAGASRYSVLDRYQQAADAPRVGY